MLLQEIENTNTLINKAAMMITKAMSLEEATKICNDANVELITYSGKAQRDKSRLKCKVCSREFDMVVGAVKAGRGCTCKGVIPEKPEPEQLIAANTVLIELDQIAEKIDQLRSALITHKASKADVKDPKLAKTVAEANVTLANIKRWHKQRIERNEQWISKNLTDMSIVRSTLENHTVRCNLCGYEWTASVHDLQKVNCPNCASVSRTSLEYLKAG
jgi:rubrerythrin